MERRILPEVPRGRATGTPLDQVFKRDPERNGRSEEPARLLAPDEWAALRSRLHSAVLAHFQEHDDERPTRAAVEAATRACMEEQLASVEVPVPQRLREQLVGEVVDEVSGLGPLQALLDDPTVSEIMVNGPKQVYVERAGLLERVDRAFLDDAHVLRVIERIVAGVGRRIDEASPMVDARLPDGSRVNAVIPPLCLDGSSITIRKFTRQPLTMERLVAGGTLTPEMAGFLRACVQARLNILVTGGTGSGKTTTLNALSGFIPPGERIITIEDAAELQLQQPHVLRMESRPPNVEGRGEIPIRSLVRNALRMRPDRIIVGECRGGEALDMLQAMNTGHDGSLSTLHCNSPQDALARLETLTLMAGMDLPARAIREQIAAAIHLVVHQARLQDGTRRITHITEVQGLAGGGPETTDDGRRTTDGGRQSGADSSIVHRPSSTVCGPSSAPHSAIRNPDGVLLQDLFRFEQRGVGADGRVLGAHEATGARPRCLERLLVHGSDPRALEAAIAGTARRGE
jgi:pilus assembly protein CpaF